MKLKTLAALVCLAQALQLGLSLYNAVTRHYLSGMYFVQTTLSVPLILFFFYVWKKQKP